MTTKQKALGKSGLIIIASIIGIMLIIVMVGYISSRVSNNVPPGTRGQGKGQAAEHEVAPDFKLKTVDNRTIRLSDYRGKIVFLNFWATWCPPCRMELPSMEKLSERLKGQPFIILAVNVDEGNPENVRGFVREMDLTFPVLIDDGSAAARYRVNAIPTTFIIKKDGVIYSIINGARPWNEQSYVDAIDKLVAGP